MRKFNITVNGRTYEVDVEELGGVQSVSAPVAAPAAAPAPAPAPAAAPAPAPAAPKASGSMGSKKVTAPMPGTIVSVKVNVGDKVTSDTLVAVLEAMKMENEIFAGADGVISSVNVNSGDSVNAGDILVSMN